MTDFGYAGWISAQEDDISLFLPRSRPSHAPEYYRRAFSLSQARKLDLFSTGLLFLWLLFHDAVVPTNLLSECSSLNLEKPPQLCHETIFENPDLIERLKHGRLLPELVKELVYSTDSLTANQKENLHIVLASLLDHIPDHRVLNLLKLIHLAGYEM